MALERRDPVPPGRYYIYLKSSESGVWAAWTKKYDDRVRVIAVEAQTITPDSPIWATTPTGSIIKEHVGDWVLFDVLSPVPWVGLGLPTIVTDPSVRSTVDVYQLPPPDTSPGALDNVARSMETLGTLAFWGGVLVLGSAVLNGVKRTRRLS